MATLSQIDKNKDVKILMFILNLIFYPLIALFVVLHYIFYFLSIIFEDLYDFFNKIGWSIIDSYIKLRKINKDGTREKK